MDVRIQCLCIDSTDPAKGSHAVTMCASVSKAGVGNDRSAAAPGGGRALFRLVECARLGELTSGLRSRWHLQLGYAGRASAGSIAEPGAISLTWTDVRSREEAEQLEAIGGLFGAELAAAPGFISVVTGGIGSRLFTIAAWESEEAIRSALRNSLHTDGIKRFHTEDFLGSFGSRIFTAHRLGPVWVRCTSCARVMKQGQTDGNCTCGKPLLGPPQRW